ncbi:MAG TPA: NAD(P)H-binding protein [Marmoricola sp.]
MKVAVAGGTGQVGAPVVEQLRSRGDDVVVLSRSEGVDLTSGSGLAEALDGVEVVVDCSSTTARETKACVDFFGSVATNLQAAAAAAGVRRIVTLSIVGIDGLDDGGPFAHYAGKLAQEAATEAGSVPTVILRATQFHGFPGQMIDWMAKGPFLLVPKQPVQTVDLDAVVNHLVGLVDAEVDSDHVRVDLAGPEKQLLADLVRATARARGKRLVAVPVWLPGGTARRIRAGALQAPAGAIIDGRTFAEVVHP